MSHEASRNAVVPLFQANAQYLQRLVELSQQAVTQGMGHSQQLALAALAESDEEIRALMSVTDVPALITVQLELTRRRWEKRQAAIQKVLQSDAGNPAKVTGELAEAFIAWNHQVSRIVTDSIESSESPPQWVAYLSQFSRMWPGAHVAMEKKGRSSR
ncbi:MULTISPECIES: hypothetical protein [Pseudomonadota]|uniref:Phasin domain-containing protein n=1 Tax=Stutzerimonas stutzeri TaxID=316 RepID=A0A2N8SZ78_STUST|nr:MULTISPECIES: hypothetical protein [Pseudomonadota]KWT88540.1 hypothetical protein APY03_3557 [Variovorax sp. WDL1]MCQ4249808.1 hypothetical protein [Stutzerimonas stutzeri]PNG07806.1 hypothetical protein CXL00_01780 [Stutzerimonas stutzeri]PNG59698.1 hypothetical protein CHC07_01427 [Variovorax sp. B4]PNG60511.1 hypothetical protein CHC06_00408 [Variovorax sp. B2]